MPDGNHLVGTQTASNHHGQLEHVVRGGTTANMTNTHRYVRTCYICPHTQSHTVTHGHTQHTNTMSYREAVPVTACNLKSGIAPPGHSTWLSILLTAWTELSAWVATSNHTTCGYTIYTAQQWVAVWSWHLPMTPSIDTFIMNQEGNAISPLHRSHEPMINLITCTPHSVALPILLLVQIKLQPAAAVAEWITNHTIHQFRVCPHIHCFTHNAFVLADKED